MSSPPPTAPRPRLVPTGEESSSANPVPPPDRSLGLLLPLAIAAALVAAVGWGLEARRVAALTEQVAALESRSQAQQAEIAARQAHLESLRSVAAAVEEQVSALRLLADQEPTVPASDPTAADRR